MATVSFVANNCTYKAHAPFSVTPDPYPYGIDCPAYNVENLKDGGYITIYADEVIVDTAAGYGFPVRVYVNGYLQDYYLQSTYVSIPITGTTSVSLVPTKTATTYMLNVTCEGVSIGYTVSTNGATGTLSDGYSRNFDFGTTRGYITLTSVTPSSGYSHPVTGSSTTGTTSWDVTDDDGSITTAGKTVNAYSGGGIRYVTLSATLGATYYGRLRLDANGGAFSGTGYTSISWPTTGAVSGTGAGGAYLYIALPVSGGNFVPKRDGYTFVGWADDKAATSAKYSSGEEVGFTARSTSAANPTTPTVYAVWEKLPDIAPFYWDGANGTNDATLIAKGQPVSNITAVRWNSLLAKIKELADACGASFSYTTVSSGDGITAARFNAARTGLANIKTALGASTTLPAAQSSGNTMYATLFNGSTSIKGALNALIGVYNNG